MLALGEKELLDLVEDLFHNGLGEEAHTLALLAEDGRKLGGWSKEALKQHVRKAFGMEPRDGN